MSERNRRRTVRETLDLARLLLDLLFHLAQRDLSVLLLVLDGVVGL